MDWKYEHRYLIILYWSLLVNTIWKKESFEGYWNMTLSYLSSSWRKQEVVSHVWRNHCSSAKHKSHLWGKGCWDGVTSHHFKVWIFLLSCYVHHQPQQTLSLQHWKQYWIWIFSSIFCRCGVLYMDPQCLHWTLIVKTWLKTFPKFIPEGIRDKLTSLFDRFCIPLLKVSFPASWNKSFSYIVEIITGKIYLIKSNW